MTRTAFLLLGLSFALSAQTIPGRYIVELDGEPAISLAATKTNAATLKADLDTKRAAVRRLQAGWRSQIARLGGRVKASTEVVSNTIVAELTEAQAQRLAATPGVRGVYPDRYHEKQDDGAINIHRFRTAWDSLPGGKETAGLGARVAIFDTGVDPLHPGFQDSSLPAVDGFPRASGDFNKGFANNKLIVLRAYGFDEIETPPVTDSNGHGSGTAMAAAGAEHRGPYGDMIAGAAPKAYLGIYKVTIGSGGSSLLSSFLRALDDAVADGMDVINYSYGAPVTSTSDFNGPEIRAIRRTLAAGVQMVCSAGNRGPGPSTLSLPGAYPEVIGVGASGNERTYSVAATLDGFPPYAALPGSGPDPGGVIKAAVVAAHTLESSGLLCSAPDAGSLAGKIVLIQRGNCTFEVKLMNAAAGGAIAGLIYNNRPLETISMNVGTARLPAMSLTQEDGEELRTRMRDNPDAQLAMDFLGTTRFTLTANRLASFSSAGPILGDSIKPDLVAVGTSFVTAAESVDPDGGSYSPTGYIVTQGTSFASPLVAGSLAVLRKARPGLTIEQYRSLITNYTRMLPLDLETLPSAPVQRAGAGILDLPNVLQGTLAASPSTLTLGTGNTADVSREVTFTNVGTVADSFTVTVQKVNGSVQPEVSSSTFDLDAGATRTLTIKFAGSGLDAGSYEGFLAIKGTQNEAVARVPYWFGAPGKTAAQIGVINRATSAVARQPLTNAFTVRVTDAAGLPLAVRPEVVSPDGAAASVRATGTIEGTYAIDIRTTAAGTYNFVVRAGSASVTLSISAF
jgi:hypothetical protein